MADQGLRIPVLDNLASAQSAVVSAVTGSGQDNSTPLQSAHGKIWHFCINFIVGILLVWVAKHYNVAYINSWIQANIGVADLQTLLVMIVGALFGGWQTYRNTSIQANKAKAIAVQAALDSKVASANTTVPPTASN